MSHNKYKRPRLREKTSQIMEEVKEEVKGPAKAMDYRTVFENAQGKVTDDRVIRKALRVLRDQIDLGEITYAN